MIWSAEWQNTRQKSTIYSMIQTVASALSVRKMTNSRNNSLSTKIKQICTSSKSIKKSPFSNKTTPILHAKTMTLNEGSTNTNLASPSLLKKSKDSAFSFAPELKNTMQWKCSPKSSEWPSSSMKTTWTATWSCKSSADSRNMNKKSKNSSKKMTNWNEEPMRMSWSSTHNSKK